MHAAVALIALALGYKTFADAHKEKEGIKLLGQVIGLFVMIAAMLAILCGMFKCMYGSSSCSMMHRDGCPIAAARMGCPMSASDTGK